ncbi:MAG: hypothetical protein OXC41_00375 [Gammaproteobacteria bacterium]|nr:hypothetical protein [Gammaproteobacteria bacterium]
MGTEGFLTSDLTFDFLDDLALATARRRTDPYAHLKARRIERIGPLLEFVSLSKAQALPFDALQFCEVGDTMLAACNTGQSSLGSYFEAKNAQVGFIVTNRDPYMDDQHYWTAFCRKAQEAAELSLPKPVAQGLIGAMREIEENVHIHSERAYDGIVGYRGTVDDFEFAVVDSGVGILKSLQRSPDYQSLTDTGTAIKTALTDGESSLRYRNTGRGYGFHDLFVGLANLNGELRFRSGDHALTIDGVSPSLVTARLCQKVEMPGFLVSILSRAGPAQILS